MIYIRKRDKVECRIVETYSTPFGDQIYLRYTNAARAKSAGDWFITREQFERLYKPKEGNNGRAND